ncbi:MAG TPA: nuclease-related domain-containing protein [Anaerolineales bacterium]|nr:nuclease-related domain-containing protein [Anaerolineales bacterium]
MKIIDKTPLVNEKGELGPLQQVQGMLKFGFNWPNELAAQKAIVTFFEHNLEKGYTLIRNITLGASGIMVPLILLGPTGIYVIHVTYLKGRYEARGKEWNEASGDGYKPAPINLIQRTTRMANAVRAFIERQGVKLPISIEPVLIAGDPGLHIESVRPAIKVLMIDGIRSFVSGLVSAGPVLRIEAVHEFTERIINPRLPKKEGAAPPLPERRAVAEEKTQPPASTSRARAIFSAADEEKPFNPDDFDFAMVDEEAAVKALTPAVQESSPAQPLPQPTPQSKGILGMTPGQLIVIAALAAALLCIVAVIAYLVFFSTTPILP